ncbi:dTDP-4-dehydrorhamnose reductase [Pseudomonadota bacterium 24LQ007]
MKILITGGSGQVGFELQRQFALHGQLLVPLRSELDLACADSTARYLARTRPDLIINAAAYTAVDKAETEPALCRRLNAELPRQLALWCQQNRARLIHYSSDYVYNGDGTQPHTEQTPIAPLNTYGRTKAEGDAAIADHLTEHLIFRTSWVYSARGNNFMKTMLRLAAERDTLSIVSDQIGAPTPARLIALVTQLAVERKLPGGLYHLTARGETSWMGFAREIIYQAQCYGVELSVTADKVAGITSAEYPTVAQRPLNSRLAIAKLESALGITLPNWQALLDETLKEYLSCVPKE